MPLHHIQLPLPMVCDLSFECIIGYCHTSLYYFAKSYAFVILLWAVPLVLPLSRSGVLSYIFFTTFIYLLSSSSDLEQVVPAMFAPNQ
jgi:hypothetical protein